MFPTEFRIYVKPKQTLLQKYINAYLSDDINLTIKEEYIMLEKLKAQREEYAAELERLKNVDIEALKLEKFEEVKANIELQVVEELNAKIADAELKVQHYDFVIENLEVEAINDSENVSDNNEAAEVEEVIDNVETVEV